MGSTPRVGIFFSYNENWVGGAYYILNLLEALKVLPNTERPEVTVFYNNPEDRKKVEAINYPGITYSLINYNNQFLKRIQRVLARKLFGSSLFKPASATKYKNGYFDAIFPAPVLFDASITKKSIFWIPDFQEARMPHFFSKHDIENRVKWQKSIAASGEAVVFSSEDALRDFNRIYPHSKTSTAVMQFAVTHPPYKELIFDRLAEKFKLPPNYFFSPNQFWVHKNQKIILEAIGKLKNDHGKQVNVVFSGKVHDPRNPNYFAELENLLDKYQIAEQIRFLGFIDRDEQLKIMQHAQAVIQPSLFEGWSTVVEDAKAMNQNIIVSDLAVHREQLEMSATYFDPSNADELANALLNFQRRELDFAYDGKQLNFARQFLKIVSA